MDTTKLPKHQKDVWQKAMKYLTEARDLLCCCNSPFAHPADQSKVNSEFTNFVQKLKSLK